MVVPTRNSSSHTPAGLSVARIVEAALKVIAERGVTDLTMNAVAAQLGVRTPSLYHHVRDKNALLALVATDAFAALDTHQDAYLDVESVEDWIALTRRGSLRLRDFYAAHPGLATLIQATARPDRDRGRSPRSTLARAQIDGLIRLGIAEELAREVFLTCAHWTMAATATEDHTANVEDTGRDHTVFLRGLDWLLGGVRVDIERIIAGEA